MSSKYRKLTHITDTLRESLEESEERRLHLEACLEAENAEDLEEEAYEDDDDDCECCDVECDEDESEGCSEEVREAFEEFLQRQCADIMVEHSLGAEEALEAFTVLVEACIEESHVKPLPEGKDSEAMALWLAKAVNSPIANASHCISVEYND